MAATTERRKSFSQFFGFSKAEPKPELVSAPAPDYPKLRRKLQKVTKQTDSDIDHAPSGHITAPAPDGGIETVKVAGDDSFLSTKYETRPISSYGASNANASSFNNVAPTKEEKRSRRESRTRFFSRSSSTSRAPNASRSASCNRASSVVPRPESSRAENRPMSSAAPAPPVPTTFSSSRPPVSMETSKSRAAVEDMEAKAAQSARQARALELLDAHERAAAHEWSGKSRATALQTPSTTPRKQELALPPSRDQAKAYSVAPAPAPAADGRPLTRPFTQFHLPYKHTHGSSTSSAPVTPMVDDAAEVRCFANRSPYPARQFVPASLSIPIKNSNHGPFTPGHSHSGSTGSTVSSASISSPMSATFSTCLSFTSASSVNPSFNTLPYCAPSVASSCVGEDHSAAGYSREHARNYSQESNADSRVVPELSYLTRGHHTRIPDSPASVTSDDSGSRTRRKKTPVYAIGQLEGNSSADEASSESTHVAKSKMNHVALNVQTPPDSPIFAATALNSGQAELSLLQSKSSIECIAEEYRALLASRGSQHAEKDAPSEANVDTAQRATPSLRVRNGTKHGSCQVPSLSKSPSPRQFLLSPSPEKARPQMSHTESYWDLRAMPGALPPSPPPMSKMTPPLPLRTRSGAHGPNSVSRLPSSSHKAAPKPKSPQPDNLSLQICVDLLARELSSAVTHRSSAAAATAASQRAATRRSLATGTRDPQSLTSPKSVPSIAPPGTDSAGSALQILVMIEAYERLRDQLVADARRKRHGTGSTAEVEQIEAMFGMWLKSLYQIHDSMTCSSDEDGSDGLDHTSDSEYDSAEEI